MLAHENRTLTTQEIVARLRSTEEELFNLRFQFTIGQLQNHNRLRELRRDIARLKTVLRERELGIDVA